MTASTLTKDSTPAEIQADWADRLTSGQYQQLGGGLRGEILTTGKVGHCCLGVLCDMAVKAGIGQWADRTGLNSRYFTDDGVASDAYPPPPVVEWAGLRDAQGYFVDYPSNIHTLSGMNDTGSSFEEIAAVIRSGATLAVES